MSRPPPFAKQSLTALVDLAKGLAAVREQSSATGLVAQTVRDTLRPDRLIIVLTDPESHTSRVAYTYQYADPTPDDPLIRHVVTTGPHVLTRADRKTLAELGLQTQYKVGSWVGVPIATQDTPRGAISAVTTTTNRYKRAHLHFLVSAAATFGVALAQLRNADLVSRGKREWEELVDTAGHASCVIDETGKILRANRPFGDLVGIPVTEIAGTPWRVAVPDSWYELLEPAISERRGVEEVRAGSRIFSVTATALPTLGGVALTFDDQTERRRLEEQLIQSAKMSAIGQLIAGVAHDLNNPLASVVGFADFLVEETEPPPAIREPLEAIRQEAERAAGIVRNLLQFARRHEQERLAQPVLPILQATIPLLQNQLTAWLIDVELWLDDDLPDVVVDRNQIQQVFVNLLTNAAQAIRTAGTGTKIRIGVARWLDGVAVTIEDDGPGVPEDIADRVFEPFFTTKAEGEGTGLGLSISQGIIKEHGGHITYVTSTLGGAGFRVELPAVAPPAPAIDEPPEPEVGPLRILVIDDEPHILHFLMVTLEAWGHGVHIAGDCAEALELIGEDSFDAIITDLRMPGIGGREFFETLRHDQPEAARRVIFATGDTVGDDAQIFIESTGQPFLRKPFTQSELRTALAAVGG